jgi:hypothetical protein
MYCEACGVTNLETSRRCVQCGHDLLTNYTAAETSSPTLPAASDRAPRKGALVKLKPHNYFIALTYVALATIGYWFLGGAKDGLSGFLRVLAIVLAFLGVFGVIALMDSNAPGAPKSRRVLRTLLAAAILGGTAVALGSPSYISISAAVLGAVLGLLGWNWIKYASI